MKVKSALYFSGVLLMGLALLAVSCAIPEEQAVQTPVVPTFVPPNVPHQIEGRSDCLLCHEKGVGGAPQFPVSHVGRPSDVCLTCHQPPATTPPGAGYSAQTVPPKPPTETTPVAVSAKEIYDTRCVACHGANRQGVPGLAPALTPQGLGGRSDTQIRDTISDGLPGTAMPAFKGTLRAEEIDALLQLIRSTSP